MKDSEAVKDCSALLTKKYKKMMNKIKEIELSQSDHI